jgi:hypothetical protein
MEIVLQMRGTNGATVKDIVDLRKFMRMQMQDNQRTASMILKKLEANMDETKILHTLSCEMSYQNDFSARISREGFYQGARERLSGFSQRLSNYPAYSSEKDAGSSLAEESAHLAAMISSKSEESNYKSNVLQAQGDIDNFSRVDIDNFDVGAFHEGQGGIPPSIPPATPNGELLHWVPILDKEVIVPNILKEDVSLTGSWNRIDVDHEAQLLVDINSGSHKIRPSSLESTASRRDTPSHRKDTPSHQNGWSNEIRHPPHVSVLIPDGSAAPSPVTLIKQRPHASSPPTASTRTVL